MTWNRPPRVCVCVCTCVKFGPMIYDRVVSGGFLSFDTADTQQRSGRSIGFDLISLVLLAAETRQSIYSVKTIETHQTLCQDSGRTESIASNPFHFCFAFHKAALLHIPFKCDNQWSTSDDILHTDRFVPRKFRWMAF